MEISTAAPALETQAQGTFFEIGSLLAALAQVTDQRSARGVRYDLAPVLLLMVLAKLSGEDRPSGIAHWVSPACLMVDESSGSFVEAHAARCDLSACDGFCHRCGRT